MTATVIQFPTHYSDETVRRGRKLAQQQVAERQRLQALGAKCGEIAQRSKAVQR